MPTRCGRTQHRRFKQHKVGRAAYPPAGGWNSKFRSGLGKSVQHFCVRSRAKTKHYTTCLNCILENPAGQRGGVSVAQYLQCNSIVTVSPRTPCRSRSLHNPCHPPLSCRRGSRPHGSNLQSGRPHRCRPGRNYTTVSVAAWAETTAERHPAIRLQSIIIASPFAACVRPALGCHSIFDFFYFIFSSQVRMTRSRRPGPYLAGLRGTLFSRPSGAPMQR